MKKTAKKTLTECAALILSLIFLIPLWMILVNSMKDSKHANMLQLNLTGASLEQMLSNYKTAYEESGMLLAYRNSIILTVISVALIVILASMTAYIIQRRKQKWISVINNVIILGMTLPAFIVPTYFLLSKLHLLHNYLGICLVYAANFFPLAVFIFTGYFRSVPEELDEAAVIDGCNPWQMYFRVILPLIKPVMATVVIIAGMSIWNEFSTALFILNSPKRYTVALTTFAFCGQRSSDWNLLFANITLISTPVILLYCFLQKYIVSGMTAGAVKG